MTLSSGDAVGPWRIERLLADGGGGQVWSAVGQGGAAAVVKVARPPTRRNLLREWQALLSLPAGGLPRPLLAVPGDRGLDALVMSHAGGSPIDQAGAVPSDEIAAKILRSALQALQVVHAAGWVHGDLHGGNLLHSGGEVALIDLGLADRIGERPAGPGLLATAAPARLRGEPADPRDDLFSLAVSLWHAWLGRPPWPNYPAQIPAAGTAPTAVQVAGDRANALQKLLADMVAPSAEHRPQSCAVALQRLATIWPTGTQNSALLARNLRAAAGRSLGAFGGAEAATPAGGWLAGPVDGGREAWLGRQVCAAIAEGQIVAELTPDGLDAQLRVGQAVLHCRAEAAPLPAFLGNPLAARAAAAGQWLRARLLEHGAGGVVAVGNVEALSPAWQHAVADLARRSCGSWVLLATSDATVAPATAIAAPAVAAGEVAEWLHAASGGLRWDGAVVSAIAAAVGQRRGAVGLIAAALVEAGKIAIDGDHAAAAGDDAAKLVRQAARQVLAAAHSVDSVSGNAAGAKALVDPAQAAAAMAQQLAAGRWHEAARLAEAWRQRLPALAEANRPQAAIIAAGAVQAWCANGQLNQADAWLASLPPALGDDAGVLAAVAELHFRAGRYGDCRAVCEQALGRRDELRMQIWLAFAATWQGDRLAAAAAMDRAEQLGQGAQSAASREILQYLRGLDAYYRGELPQATAAFEALVHAEDPTLAAAAHSGMGLVCHRRGELAVARRWYADAMQLAERCGDAPRALNMAMNVAVVDHEAGELGAALDGYARVAQWAARAGNEGALARARTNRGNLLTTLGLDREAAEELRPALQFWQTAGNAHLQGNVLCLLAEIAGRAGDTGQADTLLAQAEAALAGAGAVVELAEIQLEQAANALRQGLKAKAATIAREVERASEAGDHRELRARAMLVRAIAAMDEMSLTSPAQTAAVDAADWARAALDILPVAKPLLRCRCAAILVRALLAQGRGAAAKSVAAEHLALLQRTAFSLAEPLRSRFSHGEPVRQPRDVLRIAQDSQLARDDLGAPQQILAAAVRAINRRLGTERDLTPVLEAVLDAAVAISGAERGFLLIDDGDPADSADQRTARLRVAAARNLDRENLRRAQHKLSHTVAETVFASAEAVLTTDAQADARFADQASVHAGNLRSILSVPLLAPEGVIGAVYVDNRFAAAAFTPEHASLLAALADQAAIAIQTARLVARQRQTEAELRASQAQVQTLNDQLQARLDDVSAELDNARANLAAERMGARSRSDYAHIRGDSEPMQRLFALIDRVRDHDFAVLIHGESGTGKELVARAIHSAGKRGKEPFLAVNCAALPANLLESELFGHAKGSFTGAVADRRGLFESAGGGTVLLDEVGDMPLDMQAKLLRVLQSSEVTRVGESAPRQVRARVIAATHRDLPALVQNGQFREDLMYRLRVVELQVPSLRQRPSDIPVLVDAFLTANRAAGIGEVTAIAPAALRKLCQMRWPGNVRQLETVVKSACLFARSHVIELADLEPMLAREKTAGPQSADSGGFEISDGATLDEIIAAAVTQRMAHFGGNKRRTAESLGIDRGTLYARLRQAGGGS